jgi:hypothetical protein
VSRAAYLGPAVLLIAAALLSIDVVAEAYLTDFHFFWLGARILAQGGDPYDTATWDAAVRTSFAEFDAALRPPFPGLFRYPLWTAVMFLPLAALPLRAATAVWQLLLVTGAVAGATLALRAAGARTRTLPLFLTLVLASQPFVFTVMVAQFGGVMLLAAAAYAVASARQLAAGLALVAFAVKPHITVVLIPLSLFDLVARRQWRAVGAAGVAAAVLVGASLALHPTWPLEWMRDLTVTGAAQLNGANLAGVLTTFGLDRVWALIAIPVVLLVAVGLLATSPRLPIDVIAVGACASLILTPYSGSHDHMLLAPAWARTLAIGLRSPPRWAAALVGGLVLVASLLPWALYAFALRARPDEALNGFVPLAALALLGFAYASDRRQQPS